ncbi:MAG: SusC/RagA family TonB-linked outer membrane protein, partial [Muribaculaceae bacterium]|nr:SusC/RagA family TonB-linked outer membrane protein [Muribaculaceae bacterium]
MPPILKKEYKGYPVAWNVGGMTYNPLVALYDTGSSKRTTSEIHGNIRLEYDFKDIHPWLQGLKVAIFGNYNYSHTNTGMFTDAPYVMTVDSNFGEPTLMVKGGYGGSDETKLRGFLRASSEGDNWKIQPQITYNRDFGKHGVNLLFLYEAQKSTSHNFQTSARGYMTNDPIDISLGAEIVPNTTVGGHEHESQVSYAGRLNYDFDEKYLVEFAFRYDGSYKFAPENRWGFFPSVSAGWVMSRESFIKDNAPWISFLKLRASWGQSGKDNVTPYLYNSTFNMTTTTSAVYNGNAYKLFYTNNQYVYRDLKWQTTNTYNIGLDFDVLNYKLGAEIDVFYQYTNDIIESRAGYYPSSLGGFYPSMRNSGSVDNRGIDLTVKHQLQVSKDFNYRIRGIFGFARNKVLSQILTDSYPSYRAILGHPMGARYGLIATGLFQTQEQIDNAPASPSTSGVLRLGDIMYKDTNGDGIISYKGTNSDYVKIGYGSLPEISFSLNMDFNYKDFYLNMLGQGVTHVDYELLGSWGIASS